MAKLKASGNYLNPYEQYYDAHKTDPSFDQAIWEQSQRRGTTDRYIMDLESARDKGLDYESLASTFRFDLLDADKRLFAIENALYADRDTQTERTVREWDANKAQYVDRLYKMSDFEWNNKLLQDEVAAQLEEDRLRVEQERKDSRNWFVKALGTVGAIGTEALSGFATAVDDFFSIFDGVSEGIVFATEGKNFFDGFRYAYTPEGSNYRIFENAGVQDALVNWEKDWSYMRNVNGEYTSFGKFAGGVAYSLGQMAPSYFANLSIAGIGGKLGMSAKAASTVGKITEGLYYASLTSGNFNDMVNNPEYASVKSYDLMLNAAVKGAAEYFVQEGLNKVFGVSQMDRMIFNKSGDVLTKSGKITWKAGLKRVVKDFIHEGMEETLQQFSGYLIDSFVGGTFKDNAEWTIGTLMDAFVLGALSSLACSSFDILVKTPVKNAVNKSVEYGRIRHADKGATLKGGERVDVKNQRYIKVGDGVVDTRPKMDILSAYEFRATEQELISAYNEAMDNAIDDETRAELIGQMYATVRTLNSVYNTIGEERMQAAVGMLSVMQTNYNQQYAPTDAVNYVMSLYTGMKDAYVLKAAQDMAEHPKLKDKKLVRLQKKLDKAEKKAEAKGEDVGTVADARTQDTQTPRNAVKQRQQQIAEDHRFTILQRAAEAADAQRKTDIEQVVVVDNYDDGASIETVGGVETLVVDERLARTADSENAIIKVLSENELRDTIINDAVYASSVEELVKLYRKITGLNEATIEEVVSQILFNDDQAFINSIVWSANERVYTLLTHLQSWRDKLVTDNRIDEQIADKLDKTLAKLKKSLFEYTIAIDGEYTHLDLFNDKEKARINTARWVKDSGQAIVAKGELTANENGVLITSSTDTRIKNFVKTLNQMVNAITDAQEKQKIINGLTSDNRAARNQAMRLVSNHYRTIFNSQYDDSVYLKIGTIANNTFNMWAQHNQVTVESILQTMQSPPTRGPLYDAIRKIANTDVLTEQDVVTYFRNQFELSTEMGFTFTVYDSKIQVFQMTGHFPDSLRERAVDMQFGRDTLGEQTFTRTFAETENGTSFNVSYGFTTNESATLSDIIYDADMLTKETRDKIRQDYGAVTPQTTFQYLRSQVLAESGGNRTILVTGNNMFYYGEIANSNALVPIQGKLGERVNKAFDRVRTGETVKVSDVVGSAFVQGRMTDATIMYSNQGSKYDYENNIVYIGSVNTLTEFVTALRHEINHVFTVDNTGVRGFNERAFADPIAAQNEEVRRLVRDLKEYAPQIFFDESRLSQSVRNEIAEERARLDEEYEGAMFMAGKSRETTMERIRNERYALDDKIERLIASAFIYESSNAEATAAGLDAVQQGGDFILQEYPTIISMNGITMFWGQTYSVFGESARQRSELDRQREINTSINEGLNQLSTRANERRFTRSSSTYGIIPDTGVFYSMAPRIINNKTFTPTYHNVVDYLIANGYIDGAFSRVAYRRGIVEFYNTPQPDGTQQWTFEVHDRMTKQQYLQLYQTMSRYRDASFIIIANGEKYSIDNNFNENPLLDQLNKIQVIREASRLNMGMPSVMTMDDRFDEVDEMYKSILSSTERDEDTTIGMILPDGDLRYPDPNRDYSNDVARFHQIQEHNRFMYADDNGGNYTPRTEWYGKLYAHSEVDEYINAYFGNDAVELVKPYYDNLVQIGFNTSERAREGGNRPGRHGVDVNIRILGDLTQSQYGTLTDFIDGLLNEGHSFDVSLEYQGAFRNAQSWTTVKRDNMFDYKNGADVLAKLALNGLGLPHFASQRQPGEKRKKVTKKSVSETPLLEAFTNQEASRKYERKIDASVFEFVKALKTEENLGKLNKGLADLVREGTLTLHTLGEFIRDESSLRPDDPTSAYTLKMIQDYFYHNDNVRTPETLAFLERYQSAFSGVKYIFNEMLQEMSDLPERVSAYKSSLAAAQAKLEALKQIDIKNANEKTVNKTLRQIADAELEMKRYQTEIDLLERKINSSKHYIDLANRLLNEPLDETFFESIVKELMNDPDYGKVFTKRITEFEAGYKRVKETGRSEYVPDVGIAPGVIKEQFVKSWLGTLTDAGSIVNSAKLFAQMGYNQAGESIQRKMVSMQQQSGKTSRTGDEQIGSTIGDTVADDTPMGEVAEFVERRDKIVRAQQTVIRLERIKMLQDFQERAAKGEVELSAEEHKKIKRKLFEMQERITNMTYAELKKRYNELKGIKTEQQIVQTAQTQGVRNRSADTIAKDNARILNVLNTDYLNTKAKRKAFVAAHGDIFQLSENGRKVIFKTETHKETREVIQSTRVPIKDAKKRRDGKERFITKREKVTVEKEVSRTLNSRKNGQQKLSDLNDVLIKALNEARKGRYAGDQAQARQFDTIVAQNKVYERENKALLSEIRSLQDAMMLQNAEIKRIQTQSVNVDYISLVDMPDKLKTLMETMFDYTDKTSKNLTEYLGLDDEQHTRVSLEEFINKNTDTLNQLTTQDCEAMIDFFATSTIYAGDKYDARLAGMRMMIMGYIKHLNDKGMIDLSPDSVVTLTDSMHGWASTAGTVLQMFNQVMNHIEPETLVVDGLMRQFGIEVDPARVRALTQALYSKDQKAIAKAQMDLIDNAREELKNKGKKNIFDTLWKLQRMFMLSAPGTWIRNVSSNFIVEGLNIVSGGIGKLVTSKSKTREGQYTIVGTKVSNEIASVVSEYLIQNGLYKKIVDGLNKYSGDELGAKYDAARKRQVKLKESIATAEHELENLKKRRRANTDPDAIELLDRDIRRKERSIEKLQERLDKAETDDFEIQLDRDQSKEATANILTDSIARAVISTYVQENQFDNKVLNKIHKLLFKVLSDDPWIKRTSIRYVGKMLQEDYEAGRLKITTDAAETQRAVLLRFADAYAQASYDYMHRQSFVSKIEKVMRTELGAGAFFVYKQLFPFASAGMNWFLEGLKLSPIGLGKAIYDYVRLEHTLAKMKTKADYGDLAHPYSMSQYVLRRNLGKGIIGTIGTAIGLLLGAFGIAAIDKEDEKVKIKIGDVYIDVTDVFGTSGLMFGLTAAAMWNEGDRDFIKLVDALGSQVFDGSIYADVVSTLRYNDSIGSFLLNQPASLITKFIPNILKMITQFTYTDNVKYKSTNSFARSFERILIQSVPFLAQFWPKSVDPYTGETNTAYAFTVAGGYAMKAFDKLTPLSIKRYRISENERKAIDLGITKGELTGKYKDSIGYDLSAEDTEKLNTLYGQLNDKDLTAFYNNKLKVRVQTKDGSFKELTYNKMTDEQRKNATNTIMSKNATYAKIYVYTQNGGKYYASETEYAALKKLGIKTNVYKATEKKKGFVDKKD